jgi:hypothetical protein
MPAYDLSNISSNTDRSTNPHHTKLAAFDHAADGSRRDMKDCSVSPIVIKGRKGAELA